MDDWITVDRVLAISIAMIASALVWLFLYFTFSKASVKRSHASPASFFPLASVVSNRGTQVLGLIYSVPFSALFLVITLQARPFVESGKGLIVTYIVDHLDEAYRVQANALLGSMPAWLDPLFLVVATGMLFYPFIQVPLARLRSVVLVVSGVYARASSTSLAAAHATLELMTHGEACKQLAMKFGRAVPLIPSLVSAPTDVQLAYQLIYFSNADVAKRGLGASLTTVLDRIGVSWHEPTGNAAHLFANHIFAGATIYLVLCAGYVFLIPLGASVVHGQTWIEWPEGHSYLALSLAQRSLSFVLPLAFGAKLFDYRRRAYSNDEEAFQSIAVVFSYQFVVSLLVNVIFTLLFIAKRDVGDFSAAAVSLGEFKQWVDILAGSVTSGVALCFLVFAHQKLSGTLATFLLCLVAGGWFLLDQCLYEYCSGHIRGYYWHQGLLGVFLALLYQLATWIVDRQPLPRLLRARAQRP